jgi:hypothetical protein
VAAHATFASLLGQFAGPPAATAAAVPPPATESSPAAATAQSLNFTGSGIGGFASTLNKLRAFEENAFGDCPCIDDGWNCLDCCDPDCASGPCGQGCGTGGGGIGTGINPIVFHGGSGSGSGSSGTGSSGSGVSSGSTCSGFAFLVSPSCWLTGAGNQLIRLILLLLGLIFIAGAIYLYKGPGSEITQLPVQVVKKGVKLVGSALKAAAQSGEEGAA